MRILVNGRNLNMYPVTQGEFGASHKNSKYTSGVYQRPLDFGRMRAGYAVTLDRDCKVLSKGSNASNWIVVNPIGTPYQIMFVHVYRHARLGSTVKRGHQICQIAPTSANGGYAVHLHVSARRNRGEYFVRNLIFATAKDKLYEILKKQRPDVIKVYGTRVHSWWSQHGYRELINKLTAIGRKDVLDYVRKGGNLKSWYIKHGSKEYPNIWWVKPKPKPKPTDPCQKYKDKIVILENDLMKQKTMYDELLKKLQDKRTQYSNLSNEYAALKERLDILERPSNIFKRLLDALIKLFRNGDGSSGG